MMHPMDCAWIVLKQDWSRWRPSRDPLAPELTDEEVDQAIWRALMGAQKDLKNLGHQKAIAVADMVAQLSQSIGLDPAQRGEQ